MKNVLTTPLLFEAVEDFFKKSLQDGNRLAKELLHTLDFKKGCFFSITAKSADRTKLDQFDCGGILPQYPLEKIQVSGKNYLQQKRANSYRELSQFLSSSMKSNQDWCVFEEVSGVYSSEVEAEIKYYEKEIYYLLNGLESSPSKLYSLIKQADAMWYYMNIITTGNFELDKNLLSNKDLKIFAANTTHVVLGAYDMEGYVCWEKSSK
ncbi:MAG: hypothetical protein SP4CHLAM5_07700 [Chlamydiia bacterium]|nr:hypothetical protein [Chlamydiia bacterium]MCH9618635.1 hypothetical protein [Chlamydiia bacterium]MCH9623826.1 hypothetical protein [Chlamydiia bacterium]